MMKQYRGQRSVQYGSSCPIKEVMTDSKQAENSVNAQAANSTTVAFGCVSAGSYKGFPLAIVFPPAQSYGNLFSPVEALENGTLFADLKLPFHGNFKI